MDVWRADRWLPRGVEWHQLPTNFNDLVYPIYFAFPLIVLDHLTGGFARQTRSKRILECFWRFSYYTFAFIYGCVVMWKKSWLWDIKQCWIGYPWYYMVEMSFYYSLLLASFYDVKRSDFWQLIVHHVVTIGLLSSSFTINFIRWIVTRLGYYPLVLVRSALFDAAGLIQPDYELLDFTQVPYAPRIIIIMLFILLLLHIFWTAIIMKIVVKTITEGEAGDVRSDSELSDVEDDKAKLVKVRPFKEFKNYFLNEKTVM
ncbi:unnamed protein product [Nippostrongylus brasiliensis]|uniref:Ceramide synthase hyl-1 (inferred by orthology to a C. elegans protein) n=1 Tax=Nippostrongylus brasiliensis TaxID=27835 RepID=A0A158R1C4_NIPBR|nr:unnamed protein product [Nippostrongylus brasiliensis]